MNERYERHNHLKVLFTQSLIKLLLFNEWDEKLLIEAEVQCGFAKGYRNIIFPTGIEEIIEFFEAQQDQKMLKLLSSEEKPQKIKDRIELALKIRIKDCVPKLVHLKNSTYFAIPINTLAATKIAARTCDLIWRYAGDNSINYNYYTKRALLFPVYITSIIYYIQDNSDNNIETGQYITETLADIVKITAKVKNIFKPPKLVDIPFLRLFS